MNDQKHNFKYYRRKIESYLCYWRMRFRTGLLTRVPDDLKEIPIIINNFNRLTFLRMQIESLEKRGYRNICIIDNASTYPPLLEYYKSTPHTVFRLEKNMGYLALWESGIHKKFRNRFFVYTDPDVVPADECPDDFMEHFYKLLTRYKGAIKAGFGLKIDDLPACYSHRQEVIDWERQFWKEELEKDVYKADIDTTFALYKPGIKHRLRGLKKDGSYNVGYHIRTGGIYTARHMPWYNDDSHPDEEEKYYIASIAKPTHWSQKAPGQ